MRVLHLLKTSEGAAWAFRQMRELKALGVDVQVALPGPGKMTPLYQQAGIPVHTIQADLAALRQPFRFAAATRNLRALVRSVSPDIIHSHFVGTSMFMRLALGRNSGPLRIFQVPGPLHLENKLVRKAEIATAGSRDFWIGSCTMTNRIYSAEGIAVDRIGLSFYGTDVDMMQQGKPGLLRASLGLAEDTRLIGMVAFAYRPKAWLGQKRGIKGHEDLIDAVALLRQQGRNVHVVFAGGPWVGAEQYFQSIKELGKARLGDHATFLGTRSDVPDIYAGLDVAVHPSHSENLGGAVESMLASVPTVATRIGGFPDIVIPRETGWLCEAKSPSSLATAIAEVLDDGDSARKLAAAGRELVMRELDVRRTARQVYDYYEKFSAMKR